MEQDSVPLVDGNGKLAVIFGGFGFSARQMAKHAAIYEEHGFETVHVLCPSHLLSRPSHGPIVGEDTVAAIDAASAKEDIVIHSISGSFWMSLYLLDAMPADMHARVRALAFDSCPPRSDIYAFGGYASWALNKPHLKNYLAQLFRPVRWYQGIDDAWEEMNRRRMFEPDECVVPKNASVLFMHGRNDPVLDLDYVHDFATFLRTRQTRPVHEVVFEKAKHSRALVEYPLEYKHAHVHHLLASVDEWRQ